MQGLSLTPLRGRILRRSKGNQGLGISRGGHWPSFFLGVKFVVYNKVCTGIYVSSVAVDVDRYRRGKTPFGFILCQRACGHGTPCPYFILYVFADAMRCVPTWWRYSSDAACRVPTNRLSLTTNHYLCVPTLRTLHATSLQGNGIRGRNVLRPYLSLTTHHYSRS